MNTLVRWVYIVCASTIPTLFVCLALLGILKSLRIRLEIKRPKNLPVVSPSGVVLYTLADWHADYRSDFPVRYLFFERAPALLLRAAAAVGRLLTWVATSVTRSHVLDLRGDDYHGGRLEPADRMLHAAFALLTQFVEGPGQYILASPPDEVDDPVEAERWTRLVEIAELYEWWKTGRARDRESVAAAPIYKQADVRFELAERDQLMLARLVNVRADLR